MWVTGESLLDFEKSTDAGLTGLPKWRWVFTKGKLDGVGTVGIEEVVVFEVSFALNIRGGEKL
jgi:hypothetical protein